MDQQSEKHDLINEIRQMIDAEPLYNNPDFIHFLCARLDEAENMRDAALARAEAAEKRVAEVEAMLEPKPITVNPTEEGYYLITGYEGEAEIWYWESPSEETDDWEAGGRTWITGGLWDSHLGNGDWKDTSATGEHSWATHYRKIEWLDDNAVMSVYDERDDRLPPAATE